MYIGEVLRDIRVEKGILITDLEDKLCLSKSAISKLERGKNQLSDMKLIVKWCEALQSSYPLKTACSLCPIFTKLHAGNKINESRLN